MTQYKVKSPVGNLVPPQEIMNDENLRLFAASLIMGSDEVWKEKLQKDEIKDVIEWMSQAGYQIEKVENPT
jgi:hypothetical protein